MVVVVIVLAIAGGMIWTGIREDTGISTLTQTDIAPTEAVKSPTITPDTFEPEATRSAAKQEITQAENEDEDSKNADGSAVSDDTQEIQAVEGSDGEVILAPEIQSAREEAAASKTETKKQNAVEQRSTTEPSKENPPKQNSTESDTTTSEQSVELPIIPVE